MTDFTFTSEEEALDNYNARFAVTAGTGRRQVWVSELGEFVGLSSRPNGFYIRNRDRLILGGRPVLYSARWLASPQHRIFKGATFEPDAPRLLPDGKFNLWRPLLTKRRPGDVTLWQRLMQHVFGDSPDGISARKFFEDWAAGIFQHPAHKPEILILLREVQHAGKTVTVLGRVVRGLLDIEGGRSYYDSVRYAYWCGKYSSHPGAEKLLVVTNNLPTHPRQLQHIMKAAMLADSVEVHRMHQPVYRLPNLARHLITLDAHVDARHLEDGRHVFLWNIKQVLPDDLADPLMEWAGSDDGKAALLNYFLSRRLK